MKKDLVLHSVKHSVSSIFTKEDVINLINSIDEGSSRKITTHDIERAIDKTISSLERSSQDLLDYTSVEFSISYDNRIEVDSIRLDFEYIREALENNFMDFGELEEEDEAPATENEL